MKKILLVTVFCLICSTTAFAGVWEYFKQYQLGIERTSSYDSVQMTYDTDRSGALPSGCSATDDDSSKMTCGVGMSAGGSSGWGLFLQQAFKRQGFFYFNADLGFGVRSLTGSVDGSELNSSLPLESADFALLALLIKPYVQVGVTPSDKWPDILLSLGPAVQIAAGTVSINNEEENVVMATSSSGFLNGFWELEIVLWRFGDGALSGYVSNDSLSRDDGGTDFYPNGVDEMDNFKANFHHGVSGGFYGFGLKVVMDWP